MSATDPDAYMTLMSEGAELQLMREQATTYVRRHAVDDLGELLDEDVIVDRIEYYLEVLGLDSDTLAGLTPDVHREQALKLKREAAKGARRTLRRSSMKVGW